MKLHDPKFSFNRDELLARRNARRAKPADESLHEHKKTTQRKQQVWNIWTKYAVALQLNTTEFWFDFLRGDEEAEEVCKDFLVTLIEDSVAERVILGSGEHKEVRTIRSAATIQDKWAALVSVVDRNIMRPKRQQHPEKADYYTLSYSSRFKGGTNDRPANRVANAIPHFTKDQGLELGQLFTKRETTAEDITLILDTLWTRSKDIPCDPDIRVSFHCAIILAGIGGWRPASVISLDYKDVRFSWVRYQGRSCLVAEIQIHHVKQKEKIRRNQKDKLTFYIFRIPCQLLALTDFLASRAIADDAFAAGYQTVDEVLNPQALETNYVPLEWKPEVLDKQILSISYNQYLTIWNRTLLVAGISDEDKLRPYSMRVGAAGRLDGSLTNALRNFILSQSTQVHQDSYQPVNLRENLFSIAFDEELIGEDTQGLIELCHRGLFRRDPHAPIYVKPEDIEGWEKREDLTELRNQHKKFPSTSKEAKKIQGKIQYIRDSLERLRLAEYRAQYFKEAKRLRQLGESASHLYNSDAHNPRRTLKGESAESAMQIGELLVATEFDISVPGRLVAYIQKRFDKALGLPRNSKTEDHIKNKVSQLASISQTKPRPRCLLGCRDFSDSAALSRHVTKAHTKTFNQPFNCPECRKLGKEVYSAVGIGIEAWCSHVQRHHDKIDVPTPPDRSAYCALCGENFSRGGFTLHFNHHIRSEQFKQPFSCPECCRTKSETPALIKNAEDWILHIKDFHCGGKCVVGGAIVQPQSLPSSTKRRSEEQDEGPIKKRIKEDSHMDEEFWVTGRELDEVYMEDISARDKVIYR